MKCSLLALSSYLDGELEAGRRAEVEAHLVGCERCRAGLDCLREETERFSALGQVHVPDSAVPAFLQQLGLIGPDDVLPPRVGRTPAPAVPAQPPWLGGAGSGQALPWMPRANGPDPRGTAQPGGDHRDTVQQESDQPSLPFTDELAPAGLTLMSPPSGEPADVPEIDLSGRSTATPASPPPVPVAAALPPAPPGPPASTPPSPESAALAGRWIPHAFPGVWAEVEAGPARAPAEVPAPTPEVDVTWPQPSGSALDSFAVTHDPLGTLMPPAPAPAPWATPPPPPPTLQAPPQPPSEPPRPDVPPPPRVPPPPLVPSPPLVPPPSQLARPPQVPPAFPTSPWHTPALDERHALRPDDDPWSWAPRDDEPPPPSRGRPAPDLSGSGGPGFAPDAGYAVTSDWSGVDAQEPRAVYPEPDVAPDPLIDPLIARVAQPPQPVPPTLISRLRDQVALRLALMRRAGSDEGRLARDAPSPAGNPRSPESVGPLVAAMRSRMASSFEPSEPPDRGAGPIPAPWEPPGPDRTGEPAWSEVPFRSATIAEELPRSPAAPRVRDLDRGPRAPGRHTRQLGDRHGPLGAAGGSVAQMAGRFGDLPHQVRRLAAHPRRRWWIVAVLAVLVVTVSLVISHAGGPSAAGVAMAKPSTRPLPAASATLAPQSQPATVLQPSASTAPTPTPAPTPAPTPVPTFAAQTYGAGGSGWQLQDVRCCDVETGTGYTRIVFDLGDSSGANPTATVSFPTPTTMVVSFPGVTASGSLAASGSGGVVSGVTRQGGAPLAFRLSLSKAATVQGWAYFGGADAESSAPLHLYFDLG